VKDKVAALVVTYNRKELLKETVEAILKQSYPVERLFIVNNASTDGTGEYLKELEATVKKVRVISLKENIGGSGGFYVGMKEIICEGGYDWIWMMDDDAIPFDNALETLLEYYDSLNNRKKAKIGVLQNKRIVDKEWYKKNNGKAFPLKAKIRIFGTFVGFLVKTSVVEKVGFPRKEFFIYGDDVEYGFRIRKHGYKILTIVGSYIYHVALMNLFDYVFKKRQLIKRGVMRLSPWRMYYVTRNTMLTFRNPIIKYPLFIYYLLDTLDWYLIDKASARFELKGLMDGLKGISGKTVKPGQKLDEM